MKYFGFLNMNFNQYGEGERKRDRKRETESFMVISVRKKTHTLWK